MLSLTLNEMRILTEMEKIRSIRELARRDQVPPSQISKAIKRLEHKAGGKLIERSIHGVSLTAEGRKAVKVFRQILSQAEKLAESRTGTKTARVLSIGSTSFLINHLLVRTSAGLDDQQWRLRFLEMNPDQLTVAGLRHAFDMAFHFGKVDWPASWHQEKIGEVGWSLCCRAGHPLPKTAQVKDVLKYPFIIPSYWSQEGLFLGNDNCPIPIEKRTKGHETATAEAALNIVRVTDQVAYLPDILIRAYERLGEVRTIPLKAAKSQPKSLFISVRSEAVPEKLFQSMKERVDALLA